MNESKSITFLCPCILISFLLINIFSFNIVVANKEHTEIISDLPLAKDFNFYLKALENSVNFCMRHKIYVDLNLQYGLFLVDVNLRRHLLDTQNKIPDEIRRRFKLLFTKLDELTHYFQYMLRKNSNVEEYAQDLKITKLFYNESTWPKPSDEFNTDLLKKTTFHSLQQLTKTFGEWENYYRKVYEYDLYKPSPKVSDGCIASMGRPPPLRSSKSCKVSEHCKKTVRGGSQFGYGLTHRILFMVIARFSLECVVVSTKEDKRMTDTYCATAFNEARYIAANGFELADLMLEQIALCGLLGHAQFFQNSWLQSLLTFQTSEGCFSDTIGTTEFNEKKLREGKYDKWVIANPVRIMNGQCNGHLTAVATATLSHTLRYIIENYYK